VNHNDVNGKVSLPEKKTRQGHFN